MSPEALEVSARGRGVMEISGSSTRPVTVYLTEDAYEKLAEHARRAEVDPEAVATAYVMEALGESHPAGPVLGEKRRSEGAGPKLGGS